MTNKLCDPQAKNLRYSYIKLKRSQGVPYQKIANELNISRQRVHQIDTNILFIRPLRLRKYPNIRKGQISLMVKYNAR